VAAGVVFLGALLAVLFLPARAAAHRPPVDETGHAQELDGADEGDSHHEADEVVAVRG
jgi:hypothetical protein